MWHEVLINLLSVESLLALIAGVVGGMVIGALPGLNATMAISLLIPITYTMSPYAAFIMMMAVYTSAFYGGSLTAILIHTPGTPSSAATAGDGYALTQQGRGLEAMGMSTVASMVGGTISGIALLTLAPLLGKVSLMFSAPEYFLIVIMGLSVIGGLGGGSAIKGFLMGCFGLILGTMGTDGITGQLRFTFGINGLYSGISPVPALIGLFSISQALVLCEQHNNFKKGLHRTVDEKSLHGKFLPARNEIVHYLPNFIRSAIIGVIVGVLPGAGGDIGAWFAYSQAKKTSKHPEEFGKGSMDAICASETANNAVTGGSIIPLITLGIPGSTVAAVLLGALILHGLTPGQSMFTKNVTTTYTIIIGFILANILMGLIGMCICRQVIKITKVSDALLIPIIVVLSTIGSFSINNRISDVYMMLIFGIIGYLFRKLDLPTAPIILGMLLEATGESGFKNAILMSKGEPVLMYYLQRPASLILLILIFISVGLPIVKSLAGVIKKKSAKA
ncbi:tripartite tricarboxylate transporter permease [Oscillibacter sp.]|uniref:tripartite tricarboxylate transporter permease n=1 Tax=Oscillibacter sp. TaxID=1945593 RepID=UPI0028B18149|nr:tripartite tricarboxylate transporter permease [Oscillibacter sp.]